MTKFNSAHPVPCVYLKHGAYWLVKKGVWTRIGATLEEALAEYARRTSAPREGKLPALIERAYAHHCGVEKLADSTRKQYRIAADELKRRFKLFDPGQVKSKHVAQIKLDGAAHPNMTNRVVSFLRTVFTYAVEWQLVDSNPCVGIKRHKEAKRKRYLTDGEFAAIRAKAGPRLQVIMDLQYLTGQRISDVLKLHRKHVTADGLFFKPKKTSNSTGAMICVRWTDELRVAVARAIELQGKVPTMYVLGNKYRKAPDYGSVALQFRTAALAAGIKDARPNDQRAKSLTDANRQGLNATALAAHADPMMTQRYLRLFETVMVDGPTFTRAVS